MIFPCVVLFAVVILYGCTAQDQYVLNFDSPLYVCNDDISKSLFDTSDVEVERHNETVSVMKGSFCFLKEIYGCTLVELIVEKVSNGRTEVIVTHEICNLCTELGEESNYFKYLKHFGFESGCPFQPGKYVINNFVPDSEDMPVNQANEAKYHVKVNFYNDASCDCKDNREFLGCLRLDFLIEPM